MSKWTPEETRYLKDNYLTKTDETLAQELKRDIKSIINKRMRIGLNKNVSVMNEQQIQSVYNITDEQKKNIAIGEFRKTDLYINAKEILLDSELPIYESKWVDFITSADELTPTEKESLHIMILMSIRIDRYNKLEKASFMRALELKDPDQRRDFQKEINECTDRFTAMQKTLYSTREQRIKEQGSKTVSFLTLIREMQDEKKQNELSKEAAIMEYNAIKEQQVYQQKGYLIDGENEQIDSKNENQTNLESQTPNKENINGPNPS